MTALRVAHVVTTVIAMLMLVVTCASAQSDPKTTMLERAGWDALERNQPREAANAWNEGLRNRLARKP